MNLCASASTHLNLRASMFVFPCHVQLWGLHLSSTQRATTVATAACTLLHNARPSTCYKGLRKLDDETPSLGPSMPRTTGVLRRGFSSCKGPSSASRAVCRRTPKSSPAAGHRAKRLGPRSSSQPKLARDAAQGSLFKGLFRKRPCNLARTT